MSKRTYSLDLARFFSCVFVVFFHYFFLSYHLGFSEYKVDIFRYGFVGVYIFFFISGFVIWDSVSTKSIKQFIINRIFRLYPLYWISVLISSYLLIVIFKLDIDLITILSNLTMLQKVIGEPDLDGVYWTLFVEILFYFWVCLFFNLGVNKEKITSLFLLIVLIDKFIIINETIRVIFIIEYLPFFAAGIIATDIFKKIRIFDGLKFLLFMILGSNVIFEKTHKMIISYDVGFDITITIAIYIISICLMYIFKGMNNQSYTKKVLFLSALTYPIYLFHQNIGYLLFNEFKVNSKIEFLFFGLFIFTCIFIFSKLINGIERVALNVLR
ncbi:acyltransferase family protein [Aliivibrio fischeri]|uniref:acyltransferase family protein n=1 Tax=Aliivibrio fischeri TaxID=668 RepID=UPI0007C5D941|nr:acyltransferase family protein [Aliivibrio fischeri]